MRHFAIMDGGVYSSIFYSYIHHLFLLYAEENTAILVGYLAAIKSCQYHRSDCCHNLQPFLVLSLHLATCYPAVVRTSNNNPETIKIIQKRFLICGGTSNISNPGNEMYSRINIPIAIAKTFVTG